MVRPDDWYRVHSIGMGLHGRDLARRLLLFPVPTARCGGVVCGRASAWESEVAPGGVVGISGAGAGSIGAWPWVQSGAHPETAKPQLCDELVIRKLRGISIRY